jgi:peptide/nickel transport system substrate-binding protein
VALNTASPVSDPASVLRYTGADYIPSKGVAWTRFNDPECEAAMHEMETTTDPEFAQTNLRRAHERFVNQAPWIFIAHDRNEHAMSPKVHRFVQAQSWFQDLVPVSIGI